MTVIDENFDIDTASEITCIYEVKDQDKFLQGNWENLEKLLCDNEKAIKIVDSRGYERIPGDNPLKELPNNLPKLEVLSCRNNELEFLPDLPNIIKLDCSNNKLTHLPKNINNNLKELRCQNNKFASAESFPKNLKYLDCSNNFIDGKVENFENLDWFYCNNNKIKEIFNLEKVEEVHCENNKITTIKFLPNLREMRCKNNPIKNMVRVKVSKLITFE